MKYVKKYYKRIGKNGRDRERKFGNCVSITLSQFQEEPIVVLVNTHEKDT